MAKKPADTSWMAAMKNSASYSKKPMPSDNDGDESKPKGKMPFPPKKGMKMKKPC